MGVHNWVPANWDYDVIPPCNVFEMYSHFQLEEAADSYLRTYSIENWIHF